MEWEFKTWKKTCESLLNRNNIKKYELNGVLKTIKCNVCNGNGLAGVQLFHGPPGGGYSWSGGYCAPCNGTGYYKIKIDDDTMYLCSGCEGSGFKTRSIKCKICEGNGFVDWITFARGGNEK